VTVDNEIWASAQLLAFFFLPYRQINVSEFLRNFETLGDV
jgi:hypothetical protein